MARLTTRRSRIGAALLATAAIACGTSACGNGAALSEARTACVKIDRSIKLYKQSLVAPTPAAASALAAHAQSDLLAALGPASRATSSDGSFNALMTSLQESNRVPEQYLVESLQRQCQVVFSSTPYLAS